MDNQLFLNTAHKALGSNGDKTEEEKRLFENICDVCAEYGLSVWKYLEVTIKIWRNSDDKN